MKLISCPQFWQRASMTVTLPAIGRASRRHNWRWIRMAFEWHSFAISSEIMKTITDHLVPGAEKEMTIKTADFPGPGGAYHIYECRHEEPSNLSIQRIRFQKGTIKQAGVNGVTNEMLLAIVADRLQDWQKGEFNNFYNEQALLRVQEALEFLKRRTVDRLNRGVEGKMEK